MPIPTSDLYNDAVQNPKLSFSDAELQAATADCNGFGIPKALGGGFAITYRLNSKNGKSYAVRCFHKEVRDLQDRYSRIASCLKQIGSPLFVEFQYQPAGIKISGVGYPIVKMDWVTGTTLGEYIEQNYRNRNNIDLLRRSFTQMEADLTQRQIAHGDIQNGNILVSSQGQLRLIDYDGMFVPGMNTGGGSELGHKNFQHPNRTAADFSQTIDRFSFLVVDLSLWALTLEPSLFQRHSTGENILFSANDFADPSTSQVFHALKAISDPAFQKTLIHFETVCKSPLSATPRLVDFLAGRNIPVAPVSPPTGQPVSQKYIAALPVVDASSFAEVCQHIGDRVELIGKVVAVSELLTNKGKPYVFINFGDWRGKCARIAIWPPALRNLTEKPDATWVGRWLVVNGLIDPVYKGRGYQAVGTTLSDGSQLYKVTQDEALWRLGRGARPGSPRTASSQSSATANNNDVLKGLTGTSRPVLRPPIVPPKPSKQFPPPQLQAPVPASAQEKNEAILKSLQQSKATSASQSKPSSGGTTGPSNASQSGCLVLLASMMALIVLFACIV